MHFEGFNGETKKIKVIGGGYTFLIWATTEQSMLEQMKEKIMFDFMYEIQEKSASNNIDVLVHIKLI